MPHTSRFGVRRKKLIKDMYFKNRTEAGKLLAKALEKYKNKDVVVYALPRGGVVVAVEIASKLNAPLDLIITRKIGHPFQPEYAIAATAENGHIAGAQRELKSVDEEWLRKEIERQRKEAKRRRERYLQGKPEIQVEGKIAILVDDGIATGLTMRVGIMELRHRHPKKIVVAIPVIPSTTENVLKKVADEVIALDTPSDDIFLGAVGAYYVEFPPVEDEEVVAMLKAYDKEHKESQQAMQYNTKSMIDPTLLTFTSYTYMVEGFKKIPNFISGKFAVERFPNDELHVTLYTDVAERECIVLGSIAPPEVNMVSFLLLCHTLKKEGAQRVTAVLPYLAYSRHDKKEPQKSYAAAFIGDLLSASGVDEVVTVDVHSRSDVRLFPIPLISLSPAKIFEQEVSKLKFSNVTVVSPDEGALQRAGDIVKRLKIKKEIAYVVKRRTSNGVKFVDLKGTVGKKAIVIDDILDTGKTLIACCEKIRERGAKEIYIMVTHGLFTGSEWEKLWGLGVKRIYCTDSVPLPKYVSYKKIKVLSIIPLLAEKLETDGKRLFTIKEKQRFEIYGER